MGMYGCFVHDSFWKTFENEGGYSCVFGQTRVRQMLFSEQPQNDSGRPLDEERVLLG